jgi:O-succinylhomoserine sulfhydrylase
MNDQNLDRQSSLHPETLAIRIQQKRGEREHSVPLYMTSSFVFDDAEQARAMFADEIQGNIYTRFSNPNVNEFIEKLTVLELAEDGIGTASGMSAVFTGMAALLKSGDHIVAARSVFGSTHQILVKILPKWGITHTYIEGSTREEWENAIQPNTKMFFLETPSNPGLQLYDLEMIGKLANEKGIILNVDNCFATPIIQQPMKYGAHLVTHSATKFIDGTKMRLIPPYQTVIFAADTSHEFASNLILDRPHPGLGTTLRQVLMGIKSTIYPEFPVFHSIY